MIFFLFYIEIERKGGWIIGGGGGGQSVCWPGPWRPLPPPALPTPMLHLKFGIQGFYNKIMTLIFMFLATYITRFPFVLSLLRIFYVWFVTFSKDNPTGHSERKKKRGRQKKRWEDNIKEWTGMDFASSTRAAENRSGWKGIVANSSVVPRRPSKVMG